MQLLQQLDYCYLEQNVENSDVISLLLEALQKAHKMYFPTILGYLSLAGSILFAFVDSENSAIAALFFAFACLVIFGISTNIQYGKLVIIKKDQIFSKKIEALNKVIEDQSATIKLIKDLNIANFVIHEIQINNTWDDFTHFLSRLELFCNQTREVFKQTIKEKCEISVSIKLHVCDEKEEDIDPRIATLSRDSNGARNREVSFARDSKHLVSKNTCYEHFYVQKQGAKTRIKTNSKKYYLNNNLISDIKYKNSSFDSVEDKSVASSTDKKYREGNWPLDYRAELVFPIRKDNTSGEESASLIGFLCIDCDKTDVFNEKLHTVIGSGVAISIYNILKAFKDKNNKEITSAYQEDSETIAS